MFYVQLFSNFHGWINLADAQFQTRKGAIERAQLWRIENHEPHKGVERPVRVIEMVVHKEWACDAPVEI